MGEERNVLPALAQCALDVARAQPDHPTALPRRLALLIFARHVAPDDPAIAADLADVRQRIGAAR